MKIHEIKACRITYACSVSASLAVSLNCTFFYSTQFFCGFSHDNKNKRLADSLEKDIKIMGTMQLYVSNLYDDNEELEFSDEWKTGEEQKKNIKPATTKCCPR